jgi:hypothetical protein
MSREMPPPTLPWQLAPGDQATPPWSDEIADIIVGRYVVINISYLDAEWRTLKSQAQYHGRIVKASPSDGIVVECEGLWSGRTMRLPPVLNFLPAEPGTYKLDSTGEEIEDPDLTSSWSIVEEERGVPKT